MNSKYFRESFVLSISFNTRGFGYALFEDLLMPVDWGIKSAPPKNITGCLEKVCLQMQLLHPDVLVLQDCKGLLSRCSGHVAAVIDRVGELSAEKRITVRRYSRGDVRECFAPYGARNKNEIARTIAQLLPEFAPRVPPKRKLWKNEHYQMGLFDALSLAFTHYANEGLQPWA